MTLLHLFGGAGATVYGVLAWHSVQPGAFSLALWIGGIATLWAGWILARAGARGRRDRATWVAVVGWAVVFRLVALVGAPVYEDDHHRYRWDAFRWAVDGTPYGVVPADFFGRDDLSKAEARLLDGVNHPDLPTIYGPAAQLLFLAAYGIEPGSLLAIKALLVLAELALLLVLARGWRMPPAAWLMLAWCPLLVLELGFNAHFEALPLVLVALVLAPGWRGGRGSGAAAMAGRWLVLGVALAARPFAVFAAPFLWAQDRWRWRGPVLLGATSAAFYLPFLIGPEGGMVEARSVAAMAAGWEFNSAAYALIAFALPAHAARATCLVLLAVAVAGVFLRWARRAVRPAPPLDTVLGLMLVFSPVINPWYVVWVLPWALRRRRVWPWVAAAVVPLSYVTGLNTGWSDLENFGHPPWLRPLEFGLIAAAVIWDVRRARSGRAAPRRA